MSPMLEPYLHGALTLGCLVAGLKFLKFWRLSRDRFFVWFAIAFWCFAVEWTLRVAAPPMEAQRYLVFVPRLVGFVLILGGIVDKNRRGS